MFNSIDSLQHSTSVPSPCIGICTMQPTTALCVGCYRTVDEIKAWSSADEARKRSIWVDIVKRGYDALTEKNK
jgi:predicted Fe-S protein YdhL (DUF1289 family)